MEFFCIEINWGTIGIMVLISLFFLDELYLLVTAGWSKDKQITETELIDLKNPFTMCKKFPGNFT